MSDALWNELRAKQLRACPRYDGAIYGRCAVCQLGATGILFPLEDGSVWAVCHACQSAWLVGPVLDAPADLSPDLLELLRVDAKDELAEMTLVTDSKGHPVMRNAPDPVARPEADLDLDPQLLQAEDEVPVYRSWLAWQRCAVFHHVICALASGTPRARVWEALRDRPLQPGSPITVGIFLRDRNTGSGQSEPIERMLRLITRVDELRARRAALDRVIDLYDRHVAALAGR